MQKLSMEEIQAMNALEGLTGAVAEDMVSSGETLIFIVREGEVGKAIGKGGMNLERLREAFGKRIEVVENAPNIRIFVEKLLKPAKIIEMKEEERNGGKMMTVRVVDEDRGIAIGRNGEKIKRGDAVAKKLFNCGLRVV